MTGKGLDHVLQLLHGEGYVGGRSSRKAVAVHTVIWPERRLYQRRFASEMYWLWDLPESLP